MYLKKIGNIYLQFWNSEFYFLKESEKRKKEKEGLAIKSKVKDPSQVWKQGDII